MALPQRKNIYFRKDLLSYHRDTLNFNKPPQYISIQPPIPPSERHCIKTEHPSLQQCSLTLQKSTLTLQHISIISDYRSPCRRCGYSLQCSNVHCKVYYSVLFTVQFSIQYCSLYSLVFTTVHWIV